MLLWSQYYEAQFMDFYTTVERYGNNLLYRGYSGTERVQKKIPFRPTLFVRSDKGSWKNLQGQPVEPIEFDSMREATDFIKRYDGISNMVEGGLTLKIEYEMMPKNQSCKVYAKVE